MFPRPVITVSRDRDRDRDRDMDTEYQFKECMKWKVNVCLFIKSLVKIAQKSEYYVSIVCEVLKVSPLSKMELYLD